MRYLAGRSLLVVFDNCEHVIAQAAALAETLTGKVPGLRLIATSREPLGVPGEVLVSVGPLALPAAVELFVDRARAVRPDPRRRARASRHQRHLPPIGRPSLAVELAAARLRSLTLATLAERHDDRFRLHPVGARTACPASKPFGRWCDWSYDLLFSDERRLFARLSVFPEAATWTPPRRSARTTGCRRRDPRRFESAGRQVPRRRP